ncbi:DNRLRE domain-containing protein [Planctomycetales bacterium ZRK34]|nr:DNRLRE domain-containing protein [Planctomycetales bacterium ZRK34]
MNTNHFTIQGIVRLLAIAAVAMTVTTHSAVAATTSFQQGVSPTAAYTHDATYIRSANPTTNFNNNSQIIVGPTTGDVLRGLFEFDISELPLTETIDTVSLVLTTSTTAGINDVGSAGALTTFNAYTYNYDIDETTATWNTPGAGDATPGGTSGALVSSTSFDVEITGQTVTFANTSAFRLALLNAQAGDGCLRLMLRGADETVGTHNFTRFSDDIVTAANRPALQVTHHTPDTIANYALNGFNASSSDTEPNSTAGAFTINPASSNWGFSSAGNVFARSTATTDSEAGAYAAGDYVSFVVNPEGNLMDLTALSFDAIHDPTFGGDGEDTDATMYFFVRSSLDGYASNIGSTFAQAWNTTTTQTVLLSDAMFQNISELVEFRIYIYDSGIDIAKNGARIDNVVLLGEVAIPTPAALPAGLVMLSMVAMRRRH